MKFNRILLFPFKAFFIQYHLIRMKMCKLNCAVQGTTLIGSWRHVITVVC